MEKIRLGDACEILNGFAFKSENYVDSGIRVIRIANVQKGYIEDNTPAFYPLDSVELDKYMLEEGDLLISLTGNVGRVAILEKEFLPAALNQRVACLRLKTSRLTKGYLFHILNGNLFEQQCIQSSKGVAQKNMSTEWLKNYEIPLYSKEKQDVITEILDKTYNVIFCRQQEIQKLDDLIKARFVEMFGDPVTNPHGFEKVTLSDLAEIKIGPFGSLLHKEDYIEGGHALVNPSHIIDGKVSVDEKLTVSDDKFAELSAYHLQVGDVVMGRRGEMGRCAVVLDDGLLCGTGSLLIRTKGEVTADYIQKIISFPSFKKTIEDMAVGQTMPNLNVPIVSGFQIIKPPMEVQSAYYKFAEQLDKSKVAVQAALDKAQLLFDSLMQEYFG